VGGQREAFVRAAEVEIDHRDREELAAQQLAHLIAAGSDGANEALSFKDTAEPRAIPFRSLSDQQFFAFCHASSCALPAGSTRSIT
jgi:hypothetical protein